MLFGYSYEALLCFCCFDLLFVLVVCFVVLFCVSVRLVLVYWLFLCVMLHVALLDVFCLRIGCFYCVCCLRLVVDTSLCWFFGYI